jgi:hypothetical protein
MTNIAINPCGSIFNRIRQFISYAHVAIIGRSVRALNEVLTQLQTAAVCTGLVINTHRTMYMKSKETITVANIGSKLMHKTLTKAQ